MTRASVEPDLGSSAALPPRYASNRIALIVRDPAWAFAYWDIDARSVFALSSTARAPRWILRLEDFDSGAALGQGEVSPEFGRYYFPIREPASSYVAELVMYDGDRRVVLARSNVFTVSHGVETSEAPVVFVGMAEQGEVLGATRRWMKATRLEAKEVRRLAALHLSPRAAPLAPCAPEGARRAPPPDVAPARRHADPPPRAGELGGASESASHVVASAHRTERRRASPHVREALDAASMV